MYSPFDFNEASRHRVEYVDEKLREGSPVVGISYDAGLLMLTVRKSQRKIYEIYDRLLFSAIGRQADVEQIRIGAIDVAHREGFERSPDDVTAHRLVGFVLSPPLKRLFGDQLAAPAVIRAVFGELGRAPSEDAFYVLNYDGEFHHASGFAAIAGTTAAEDRMALSLLGVGAETRWEQAVDRALRAWAIGAMETRRQKIAEDDIPVQDLDEGKQVDGFLREELKTSQVEVGLLERFTGRESKFRLLGPEDLDRISREYR